MAKRSIEESTLIAIADAIREKGGTTAGLDPEGEMPQAILDIKGAEITELDNEAGGKTVYINSEVPKLPEGFTRLKWIQSDGKQSLNTGHVVQSEKFKVFLDFMIPSSMSAGALFGSEATAEPRYSIVAHGTESTFAFYVGKVPTPATSMSLSLQTRYQMTAEANAGAFRLDFNGTEKTGQYTTPLQKTLPLALFGSNVGGTLSQNSAYILYGAQIYDNDVLVRDYVPCLNASGEAGLWDTVTQAFFGDAAGVGFIAGPVVLEYELPEGYEELAWIESDGRQYVDTGVLLDSTSIPRLRVVADIELVVTSGKWSVTGSGDQFPIVHFGINPSGKISYGNGASDVVTTTTYTQARYTWDYDLLNKRLLVGATNITGITVNASGTGGRNFYISAYSNNTSAVKHEEIIFGYQIYDNGTIVRYYVPCRTNTGEVGLWDAVNSEFYGDAAGVGFIAGPVVGNSVSKVVLEDEVLIDLTGDTISPETVLAGFIGHDKTGAQFVGEASSGSKIVTGFLTASGGAMTLQISGLPFMPTDAVITLMNNKNSGQYTERTVTGVDTISGYCTMNHVDYYGASYALFRTLQNVTREQGSIKFSVQRIEAGNYAEHVFEGTYRYVVWGE